MSSHRAELPCHLPPAVALDGTLRYLGSLGYEGEEALGHADEAVVSTFGVTGAVLLLSNDAPAETKAAVNATHHKPAKTAMPCGFVAPYATPTGAGAAAFMTF